MIKINVTHEKEKTVIKIDGHAGYSDKGKDIVCAGVSTLFCTLAEYLMENDKALEYKGSSGNALITAKTEDGKILDSVETILTGYRMLAEEYGDYVTIEEREEPT